MLDPIFGSQTVRKTLLFIFVNEKCYGTQLHKCLNTPLTPIQKALQRLEKGGVIMSYYEGKTRLYKFNPAFPLLPELESLLKKSYTLLSPFEKKIYTHLQMDTSKPSLNEHQQILNAFWQRLCFVKTIHFQSKSQQKEPLGWNSKGKGEVLVVKESDNVYVFHEKGSWKNEHQVEVNFNNTFRWTLDLDKGLIALEHLRYGFNNPVFLFHLAPSTNQTLTSIDSHLCEGDTYFGQVHFDSNQLRLCWRIIGPKKNHHLEYHYGY